MADRSKKRKRSKSASKRKDKTAQKDKSTQQSSRNTMGTGCGREARAASNSEQLDVVDSTKTSRDSIGRGNATMSTYQAAFGNPTDKQDTTKHLATSDAELIPHTDKKIKKTGSEKGDNKSFEHLQHQDKSTQHSSRNTIGTGCGRETRAASNSMSTYQAAFGSPTDKQDTTKHLATSDADSSKQGGSSLTPEEYGNAGTKTHLSSSDDTISTVRPKTYKGEEINAKENIPDNTSSTIKSDRYKGAEIKAEEDDNLNKSTSFEQETGYWEQGKAYVKDKLEKFYGYEEESTSGDRWGYRSPCKYVGLQNGGATCYMNSVLQQLFHSPTLNESISNVDERDRNSVLRQLQEVFNDLKPGSHRSCYPGGFWRAFSMFGQPVQTGRQQDAFEFYTELMLQLDNCLKKTGDTPALRANLQGIILNRTTPDCGHINDVNEFFFAITLPLTNHDLEESLKQYVTGSGVKLDGRNAFLCQKCDDLVPATREMYIKKLPPVLVIHLKRFEYDWYLKRTNKFNTFFSFPRLLDMYPYTTDATENMQRDAGARKQSNNRYQLVGIVMHTGSADSGHYYSYVKDRWKTPGENSTHGNWFECNDTRVFPINLDDDMLISDCFGSPEGNYRRMSNHNAYILVYERTDGIPEVTVTQAEENRGTKRKKKTLVSSISSGSTTYPSSSYTSTCSSSTNTSSYSSSNRTSTFSTSSNSAACSSPSYKQANPPATATYSSGLSGSQSTCTTSASSRGSSLSRSTKEANDFTVPLKLSKLVDAMDKEMKQYKYGEFMRAVDSLQIAKNKYNNEVARASIEWALRLLPNMFLETGIKEEDIEHVWVEYIQTILSQNLVASIWAVQHLSTLKAEYLKIPKYISNGNYIPTFLIKYKTAWTRQTVARIINIILHCHVEHMHSRPTTERSRMHIDQEKAIDYLLSLLQTDIRVSYTTSTQYFWMLDMYITRTPNDVNSKIRIGMRNTCHKVFLEVEAFSSLVDFTISHNGYDKWNSEQSKLFAHHIYRVLTTLLLSCKMPIVGTKDVCQLCMKEKPDENSQPCNHAICRRCYFKSSYRCGICYKNTKESLASEQKDGQDPTLLEMPEKMTTFLQEKKYRQQRDKLWKQCVVEFLNNPDKLTCVPDLIGHCSADNIDISTIFIQSIQEYTMSALKIPLTDDFERSLDLLKGLLLIDDNVHKNRLHVSFEGIEGKKYSKKRCSMIDIAAKCKSFNGDPWIKIVAFCSALATNSKRARTFIENWEWLSKALVLPDDTSSPPVDAMSSLRVQDEHHRVPASKEGRNAPEPNPSSSQRSKNQQQDTGHSSNEPNEYPWRGPNTYV